MVCLETLPTELLLLVAEFVVANALTIGIKTKVEGEDLFRWSACDLAALALANRQFNRIFEPLLYQWDEQQVKCHSVPWAIKNDQLGTLERALASGFDLNRTLPPYDGVRDKWNRPQWDEYAVGFAVATKAHRPLKWLLEHGAKPDPIEPRVVEAFPSAASFDRESPLFQTFQRNGHYGQEAALSLLSHGARVFFVRDDGWYYNALCEAAKVGFDEVVEHILQNDTMMWSVMESGGRMALDNAALVHWPVEATIEVLLRHRALRTRAEDEFLPHIDDIYEGSLELAFHRGHVDNVIAILRHVSQHDPEFFTLPSLYTLLSMLDRRLKSDSVTTQPEDYKIIMSKLVEFGVDFNAPRPAPSEETLFEYGNAPLVALAAFTFDPRILSALCDVGADLLINVAGDRTLFDIIWEKHVQEGPEGSQDKAAALLRAGARMDAINSNTVQTAIELAVEAADDDQHPDCEALQFLLQQPTASALARDHIYEVLEENMFDMKTHLTSCIFIMQHGFISAQARLYVFDWLVSYATDTPSGRSDLYIDDEDWEHTSRAARFFPSFLNKRQLDKLWESVGATHRSIALRHPKAPRDMWTVAQRWAKIPWIEISVQRGDIEALEALTKYEHPVIDVSADDDEEDLQFMGINGQGSYSPLMLAIAAGHRDVALWLIKQRDPSIRCKHPMGERRDSDDDYDEDEHQYAMHIPKNVLWSLEDRPNDLCRTCRYGQRSACELALHRGEVELFEAMWDLDIEILAWRVYRDIPRVYSYGNLMLEWLQLRLGMKSWMTMGMSGQDAWLREEIRNKLQTLREEIIEVREAWRARAKIPEEKRLDFEDELFQEEQDELEDMAIIQKARALMYLPTYLPTQAFKFGARHVLHIFNTIHPKKRSDRTTELSPMARLDTLPIEILHLITGHLKASRENEDGDEDEDDVYVPAIHPRSKIICDLSALSRTSRHFHQIFNLLLYQWTRDHEGYAVSWAIVNRSYQTIENALSVGFDLHSQVALYSKREGSSDFMIRLTPLKVAITRHCNDVLKWLLDHGADPDHGRIMEDPYETGDTNQRASDAATSALYYALHGYEEASLMLMDYGVLVYFATRGGTGDSLVLSTTALHVAAAYDLDQVVERLLAEGTIAVDEQEELGSTPLHHAASALDSRKTVIEILLQRGANPHAENDLEKRPLEEAIEHGHIDNVLVLIQALAASFSSYAAAKADSKGDSDAGTDAGSNDSGVDMYELSFGAAHGWSHLQLYHIMDVLSTRLHKNPLEGPREARLILTELRSHGADFNNPPAPYEEPETDDQILHEPLLSFAVTLATTSGRSLLIAEPVILTTLLELGVDPMSTYMPAGQTVFNIKCLDYLSGDPLAHEDALAVLLHAGARMDFRDPVTGKTVFESFVDACDTHGAHGYESLMWLLDNASYMNVDPEHVRQVLELRLENVQNHLLACIIIMQRGYITTKARLYVFDWLVSFITGISVRQSSLYLDKSNVKFNKKAAKFFPSFLRPHQKDELWAKALASYTTGLHGPYGLVKCPKSRFRMVPWLHVNAERGDVSAVQQLLDWGDTHFRWEEDGEDQALTDDRVQSPLMRAIYGGKKDVASLLIERDAWEPVNFLTCTHVVYLEDHDGLPCMICPHGQASPCDIAISCGEMDLLEEMWDHALKHFVENRLERMTEHVEIPRVYSHGNVVAEWVQLKMGMGHWMSMNMTGEDACWLRQEMEDRLEKLRLEVAEIRHGWIERFVSAMLARAGPEPLSDPSPFKISVEELCHLLGLSLPDDKNPQS